MLMWCPNCRAIGVTEVIDSRENPAGTTVRRRRLCGACRERFTTYETTLKPAVWDESRTRATEIATALREMASALESWSGGRPDPPPSDPAVPNQLSNPT